MPRVVRNLHNPSSLLRIENANGRELRADAMKSFNTVDDRLSVFELTEDGLSEERLVAAIIAGRQKLDRIAYVVFDDSIRDNIDMGREDREGKTPDKRANRQHVDYVVGTATRLYRFVIAISEQCEIKECEVKEVRKKRVREIVVEAVRENSIEFSKLEPKIQEEIKQYLR